MEYFYHPPEFVEWMNEETLNERFSTKFVESGWYELPNGDYLLILERYGKLKVTLWVGFDPREEIEKLLDLKHFD